LAKKNLVPGTKNEKINSKFELEGRAIQVLQYIKTVYPNMEQTELEKTKISENRDVGLASLESYSRVLEGRSSAIFQRIQDVLDTNIKLSRKRGLMVPNLKPPANMYPILPSINPTLVVADEKDANAFDKVKKWASQNIPPIGSMRKKKMHGREESNIANIFPTNPNDSSPSGDATSPIANTFRDSKAKSRASQQESELDFERTKSMLESSLKTIINTRKRSPSQDKSGSSIRPRLNRDPVIEEEPSPDANLRFSDTSNTDLRASIGKLDDETENTEKVKKK